MTTLANIENVEAQIVTALAGESVTAYAYEDPLMDEMPLATVTLTPPHAAVSFAPVTDQAIGIESMTWTLRYYVDLSEGLPAALSNLKTGIVALVNALGADRTLSSKCRSLTIGNGTVDAVATQQRPCLMFEAPLTAVLHPNVGA